MKAGCGKLHVQFERRTEASARAIKRASSDPTPRMATKVTSRPEGGPRLVRSQDEKLKDRTQGRTYLPDDLVRVNDAAKRWRQTRFTALLHHVDVEALERAFWRLRRKAAPGVDGVTVETYEGRLVDNLRDLCDRVHSGRYKPLPVRRTYIPKADGGRRPLGILVLEDKIVQGAVQGNRVKEIMRR